MQVKELFEEIEDGDKGEKGKFVDFNPSWLSEIDPNFNLTMLLVQVHDLNSFCSLYLNQDRL